MNPLKRNNNKANNTTTGSSIILKKLVGILQQYQQANYKQNLFNNYLLINHSIDPKSHVPCYFVNIFLGYLG